MTYVLTWWERPGGSCADHERAQQRVLEVFQTCPMPESLTFHQFLVRVGEFGGCAVSPGASKAVLERNDDESGHPSRLRSIARARRGRASRTRADPGG